MLAYGKTIFKSNWTQIFVTLLCFGLAILAKSFSLGTINLSLKDFLSFSLDNLLTSNTDFNVLKNLIAPIIFYLCSAILLLWMSISNFSTFQHVCIILFRE